MANTNQLRQFEFNKAFAKKDSIKFKTRNNYSVVIEQFYIDTKTVVGYIPDPSLRRKKIHVIWDCNGQNLNGLSFEYNLFIIDKSMDKILRG